MLPAVSSRPTRRHGSFCSATGIQPAGARERDCPAHGSAYSCLCGTYDGSLAGRRLGRPDRSAGTDRRRRDVSSRLSPSAAQRAASGTLTLRADDDSSPRARFRCQQGSHPLKSMRGSTPPAVTCIRGPISSAAILWRSTTLSNRSPRCRHGRVCSMWRAPRTARDTCGALKDAGFDVGRQAGGGNADDCCRHLIPGTSLCSATLRVQPFRRVGDRADAVGRESRRRAPDRRWRIGIWRGRLSEERNRANRARDVRTQRRA